MKRRKKIQALKEERESKVKESEEKAQLRESELEKEKQSAEEEGIEFNLEEFESRFLEKNPIIVIPDEVEFDVDQDFNLDDESNE